MSCTGGRRGEGQGEGREGKGEGEEGEREEKRGGDIDYFFFSVFLLPRRRLVFTLYCPSTLSTYIHVHICTHREKRK